MQMFRKPIHLFPCTFVRIAYYPTIVVESTKDVYTIQVSVAIVFLLHQRSHQANNKTTAKTGKKLNGTLKYRSANVACKNTTYTHIQRCHRLESSFFYCCYSNSLHLSAAYVDKRKRRRRYKHGSYKVNNSTFEIPLPQPLDRLIKNISPSQVDVLQSIYRICVYAIDLISHKYINNHKGWCMRSK